MNKLVLTTASVVLIAMAGMASAAEPSTSSSNLNSSQTSASAPSTQSSSAVTSPVNVSEDQIKAAQQQLKTAGDYKGSVDGKMGPEMKQALEQFQKQHGLQATGALDQETLAALQSNSGQAGSSTTSTGQTSTAGGYNNSSNPHR
jgi:peptidoglycan hydrolase-like protein with peptidoglycan-binding domain